MRKILRVGIVGAGLIGGKRAAAAEKVGGSRVVAVADPDRERRRALSEKFGCVPHARWQEVVRRGDIDVVVVAVPNAFAFPIVVAALRAGKHVLCEKPFGVNGAQARAMVREARRARRLVKVGFNHRFHPAIWCAHEVVAAGKIGTPIFIRAAYGHGGRAGMEKEWRSKKAIAGGGELLDQGVHVIDLCRWFAGEIKKVYGVAERKFWKGEVEDNAFAILKTKTAICEFHVSTTNWGNIFSLEIFGDKGAVAVEGLGRHYGQETLRVGVRQGPFNDLAVKTYTYPPGVDGSWEREWRNFISAIRRGAPLVGDAVDGYRANLVVDALYRSSKIGTSLRM